MSNKFDEEIYKYLKCEFWVFEINFEKTKYLNISKKLFKY